MIKEPLVDFIGQALVFVITGALIHGWSPWKYLKRKKWQEKEIKQEMSTSMLNSKE
jgi:hypothetical protein